MLDLAMPKGAPDATTNYTAAPTRSAAAVRRGSLILAIVPFLLVAWVLPGVAGATPFLGTAGGPHAATLPHAGSSVERAALTPPTGTVAHPKPVPSSTGTPSPASQVPAQLRSNHFQAPTFRPGGVTPQSWTSATPPGWEYPLRAMAAAANSPTPQNGLPGSYQQWLNNWCNGIWPDAGGQSAYQADCYGHDEPGIQFYSNLPGSGGNVTWQVTLPVSRGPTANQSDLYSAVWFGMTLNVPNNAWMNQCFLELQFYPDSGWYAPGPFDLNYTVYGNWVGAAVAWQIQASTGNENPCFYEPLYLNGNPGAAFLNMSQGDQITVQMTGWAGDPTGEALSIVDQTNGQRSSLDLYNGSCATAPAQSRPACGGNYPLDPAYAANDFENGLQWTPGGEYPVGYAFEIGHAGNPAFPNNNAFGGCNPGLPGSYFGGTPCPSYDPGSWANDTLTPWQFQVPTFSNAQATQTPAQVAFTDPQGGLDLVNGGNIFGAFPWSGGCSSQMGTAFCSYPWYSYYCGSHSFEFGALDYPGVSADFNQYWQYQTQGEANGAGWQYYAPINYSIPSCAGASYGVDVGPTGPGSGAAYFLSQPYSTETNVSGLGPGEYALNALPAAGSFFRGWTTGGGVAVADATSAYTSLDVQGDGFALAVFGSTPATNVTVTWAMSGAGGAGTVEVGNGSLFVRGPILGPFSNGGTVVLAPGTYGIEAYPAVGYNFSGWSIAGSATVAAAAFPWTQLVVTGDASTLVVTANFVWSGQATSLVVVGYGDGTVTFNGTAIPYYGFFQESFGYFFGSVGGYQATATPAPGWTFLGWSYSPSAVMNGFFENVTWVNLEGSEGSIYGPTVALYAYFQAIPPPPFDVTFVAAPAGTGMISVAGGTPSADQSLALTPQTVVLWAVPGAGQTLASWAALPAANVSFSSTTAGSTSATIYGNATIWANFTAGAPETVGFVTWPSNGGSVLFNFQSYSGVAYNASVALGTYAIDALPAPGYTYAGFETFGPVYVTSIPGSALVYGNGSYIDVIFHALPTPPPPLVPVTFIASTPGTIDASFSPGGASGSSGGTTISSGETVWLTPGSWLVQAWSPTQLPALQWVVTDQLAVSSVSSNAAMLTVYGPGTLYAVLSGVIGPTTVSASLIDTGSQVTFSTSATSFVGGSISIAWNGLPAGCVSTALTFTCSPTTAGTFNVSATATFAGGVSGTSNFVQLVVTGVPAATITIAPHAIDLGSGAVIHIAGGGGAGGLALSVAGLPAGCFVNELGPTSCIPLATGSFTVTATVTDALGATASASATLVVNAPIRVVSLTPSTSEVTAGQPVTLDAMTVGGTAPNSFVYLGLPTGCTASTTANDTCTTTAPGTYSVTVLATDVAGSVSTASTTFVVNPAPEIVSFTASDPTVAAGGTVVFAVNVVGGTLPWTYSYSGAPAGCTAGTSATFACSPTTPGTYTVTVTVSDADHATTTAQATLTVAPPTTTTGSSSTSNGAAEDLAIAALVVGILALAVAVVLGMRGKGPSGSAPANPPPRSWREEETGTGSSGSGGRPPP